MDSSSKNARVNPSVKDPSIPNSKTRRDRKVCENHNPNLKSPASRASKSPAIKSTDASSRRKMKDRKFLVAKKSSMQDRFGTPDFSCSCKDGKGGKRHKCRCIAYDKLRSSQEEFFNNISGRDKLTEGKEVEEDDDVALESNRSVVGHGEESEVSLEDVSLRDGLPEPGSGRVMHLVKAFECLLSPPSKESEPKSRKKPCKGAETAPQLQHKLQESMSSFCPSDLFMASSNVDLDSRLSSSWDSSRAGFGCYKRVPRGRRSRRNSSESSDSMRGHRLRRQLKFTNQRPFKLKTEQRGKLKEIDFIKKVQEMMVEEEKRRIPIAQGLPWTTDEAECLLKPPVKESTRPMELKLHSDTRAVERAEFDQQIADKLTLIEQYKMERERQEKMKEEEEIKRLRKDLIHKAHPMPYFDKPFMITRSMKDPTILKEPSLHMIHQKKMKCRMSSSNLGLDD